MGGGEIQEQIDNLSGDHRGIRLLQRGLGLLLADTTMSLEATQMVIGELAVFDDGNVAGILPQLIQHLTSPDRKALLALPDRQRKDAQGYGEEYALVTAELSPSQLASDAIAALDMPEGRCPGMNPAERDALSNKVAKKNKETAERPRNN